MSDLKLTDEDLLDALPPLPPAPVSNPTGSRHPSIRALAVDPAALGFPPMLAVEVAMQTAPIEEIFQGYGLTISDYEALIQDPIFLRAIKTAKEQLQEEGMSFKIKAKLQAEELLKKSWAMIHDVTTPHNVRADLIKSTMRWAGHEPKAGGTDLSSGGTALQININLGDKA